MAGNTDYRLMGKLYHTVIKKLRLCTTVDDFFDFFLGIACNAPAQSDIFKYDYYTDTVLNDIEKILSDQSACVNKINSELIRLSPTQMDEVNKGLINIVSTVKDYSKYGSRSAFFSDDCFKPYEPVELSRLKAYFSANSAQPNIGYNIYNLIYLSANKRLPQNFYFGVHFREELEEFNNEVTLKYGVTSKPGIRAIINLVERSNDDKLPNLFAMYEYADMLYYGSENGPQKDINEAFKTYKLIADENNDSRCHPLAFWTLAFIYFNYHQPKTELASCDTIREIEALSRLDQLKAALRYAKYAYDLIESAPAANILGKISALTDEDVPSIEALKAEYDLASPLDYYQYAADHNYIYAYAGIAMIYSDLIFSDIKNREEHLEKYLMTLKKQADQYEPWAANTLGMFYLNATVKNRKTGEKYIADSKYIDRKKAFLFFSLATSQFNDVNSAWAYANMIIYFPNKYIADEDLNTITSHLERLRSLKNAKAIGFVLDEINKAYSKYLDNESISSLVSILQDEGER